MTKCDERCRLLIDFVMGYNRIALRVRGVLKMRRCNTVGRNSVTREEGSLTTEAAIVVPMILAFVAILIGAYINVYSGAVRYSEKEADKAPGYADVHRAVSSIFDAGGDIFEMLFGEE